MGTKNIFTLRFVSARRIHKPYLGEGLVGGLRVFSASLLILAAGCAPAPNRSGGDILVIGDSVMASHRASRKDIGSVIRAVLDRQVTNRSAFGAQIRAGEVATRLGRSIPGQLPPGRWNWVVVNGGANDLGFSCGCTRCAAEIDALISRDGTNGDIPDLANKARFQGANVLWVGYYKAPETTTFRGCRPGLVEIEKRITAFAKSNEGVFFLDAEDVFDPPSPELFDSDKTHPSAEGSARIGEALARLIAENSRN
ncbi:SGNH/GDSL hydrolase family protein [Marimonas arenosa]|uniref:SGNH/GDSL hydrolase family protein n=2 Tax=Marimonas arenosa TaxID=1795305 RepID=A0AAE3WFF8_9RHOB|nr:SGNH/GDSL hydrolase family protein [Marimonas arenosa]